MKNRGDSQIQARCKRLSSRAGLPGLTGRILRYDNKGEMQLSVNKGALGIAAAANAVAVSPLRRLADLREGEVGILDRIDLPIEFATRLMELGFLPGMSVTAARCAPGGDPRVFRVDGSEIALRRETAAQLLVRM